MKCRHVAAAGGALDGCGARLRIARRLGLDAEPRRKLEQRAFRRRSHDPFCRRAAAGLRVIAQHTNLDEPRQIGISLTPHLSTVAVAVFAAREPRLLSVPA